mgnify:CR=1 FL=1
MALLYLVLAISSITGGSLHPVDALAFEPQLQLPNLFNVNSAKSTFSYTHLECNGQLWTASNGKTKLSIVIDPLASQLDFGIPWGYRANKQTLSEKATIDLICDAKPEYCLLTMGLDDHTHLPTLSKLRERMPELRYIVAPSCEQKLVDFGLSANRITGLDHGETCKLIDGASVTATEGALVGPPWQKRENGFLMQLNNDKENGGLSIYYEPHGDVVLNNIKSLRADVMVAPVTKQSLPAQVPAEGQFTLVYGGERTLEIADVLGAKVIVPLGNGALDTAGPLAKLVKAEGDVSDFEKLVEQRNVGRKDGIRVAIPTPGRKLTVSV